jgi:hypothetical protein
VAGAGAAVAGQAAGVALELDPQSAHHAEVTVPVAGTWEIHTTGVDPFVATRPFPAAPREASVLTFEYLNPGAVKPLEVFAGFPWSEARSHQAEELPYSEGWTTFSLDLRPALDRATAPLTRLRIDFGREPGRVLQVRGLRLRPPEPGEEAREAGRQARRGAERAQETRLRAYLDKNYEARVTRVEVGTAEVVVHGDAGGATGEVWLAESPVWQHVAEEGRFASVRRVGADPGAGRGFVVRVPRHLPADAGGGRDRLFSRWLLVRRGATGDEVLSAVRYADQVTPRHDWPRAVVRGKKGLGGFHAGRPELVSDLDTLGITSVTVNLFLGRYLQAGPSPRAVPFERGGRTYYANVVELEKLDRALRAAAERGALVLGILLVPKAEGWASPALGAAMQHPDCDPAGTYSMANVTSAAGVQAYADLVDFLAERFSRPGAPHGRIHHWIVHNEVDAGWTWTNCGEKPPLLYVDQYHKSMRLAHLIARQYDPHARAYVSLTHFWTETATHRYIPGRDVLRHLLAFSRVEGDFDWGIAHHPYPESLREPKTWRDRRATFDFGTPLITFRNLEVLDAWVKVPAHRFRGREVRSVHLSEQGPNSPDYSETALAEQAASLAYVWPKVRALDAIEAFQFHNWADHRREGGLRIGLRRFPDDADAPLAPKPIWHVYRALDTPGEAEATAFALPIVGVRSWDEVVYRGKITGTP